MNISGKSYNFWHKIDYLFIPNIFPNILVLCYGMELGLHYFRRGLSPCLCGKAGCSVWDHSQTWILQAAFPKLNLGRLANRRLGPRTWTAMYRFARETIWRCLAAPNIGDGNAMRSGRSWSFMCAGNLNVVGRIHWWMRERLWERFDLVSRTRTSLVNKCTWRFCQQAEHTCILANK